MAGLLDEYFRSVARHSPQLGGRDGVRGRVDAIVNALQLPASLDKDGDWKFETDVGPFFLLVDKDEQHLVLLQNVETINGRPKNSADSMLLLLLLNYEAAGTARFSVLRDGEKYVLALTSRMPVGDITGDSVEQLLADGFRLSRSVDEALGKEPAQAPGEQQQPAAVQQAVAATNGSPPAGWYPAPEGNGSQRWWDGARWTEHVA